MTQQLKRNPIITIIAKPRTTTTVNDKLIRPRLMEQNEEEEGGGGWRVAIVIIIFIFSTSLNIAHIESFIF